MSMTPKEQRIAIAEVRGWEKLFEFVVQSPTHRAGEIDAIYRRGREEQPIDRLPNYPNDLNACYEMENALTNEQWEQYTRILSQGITRTWWECSKAIAHSSSEEKCEAFCRVMFPERWIE